MLNSNFLKFALILLIISLDVIYAMRCEDGYSKNSFGSVELLTRQQFLHDMEEIKSAIEVLNSRQPIVETKVQDLPMFDIRYDTLPQRCQPQKMPSNCGEATACTHLSGYYYIKIPDFSNDSFLVECDAHTDGGDWLVIQRRHDGSVDFFRTWSEYQAGFGNINTEFFIGLDKLHGLTNLNGPQELMILMENATNSFKAQVKYDGFVVGNESEKYALQGLGRMTQGDVRDSMRYHLGSAFTTKDQDNDQWGENCALSYMGAWWHKKCHNSNLNGHYGDTAYGKGINWLGITDNYASLKYVKMMIRRRRQY